MLDKHFLNDYREHVRQLKATAPSLKEAMSQAIGGNFDAGGQIEADLLRLYGLRSGMHLVDLGCGSGRAAVSISRDLEIEYHGIDVVQDLLDFARANTPPNYRYSLVEQLQIPDRDASADMVCAFSLFTHLLHEETYIYLEECARVLKPGGRLVFSFLEFHVPPHWAVFASTVQQVKNANRSHLNVFIERNAIALWAQYTGFSVESWMDSTQGPCIPLSRPVVMDSGEELQGGANLGQSVCVLRKP